MADKDTITKEYMCDNAMFADAFNFLLYDGEQIIKPEQLRPLDTASIALPCGKDGKLSLVQKYIDLLKMTTVKCAYRTGKGWHFNNSRIAGKIHIGLYGEAKSVYGR